MRTDGRDEKQHYVPRFMLRRHWNGNGKPGEEQIWCLSKADLKTFSPNIKGVAAEGRFYEIEINGEIYSLEPYVTRIEDEAASIFNDMIEGKTPDKLSRFEKRAVSYFCTVQLVRTESSRISSAQIERQIRNAIEEKHGKLPPEWRDLNTLERRHLDLYELFNAIRNYGNEIANKHMYMMTTADNCPFVIGDNGMAWRNFEPGGRRGINSKGILITLPLTPTKCLALADKQYLTSVSSLYESTKSLARLQEKRMRGIGRNPRDPARHAEVSKNSVVIKREINRTREMLNGKNVRSKPEEVIDQNLNQLYFASRYVFAASKSGFDALIEERQKYSAEEYSPRVSIL